MNTNAVALLEPTDTHLKHTPKQVRAAGVSQPVLLVSSKHTHVETVSQHACLRLHVLEDLF